MTLPGLLVGFLIASASGFAFHLIRGGSLSRMALYLATAWIAFFIGHFVAQWFDWPLMRLGTLNIIPALLATFIGLIIASILARPEKPSPPRRDRTRG